MLRGPSEISSWFEKRFFLDAHESRFSVRVFPSLFLGAQKHLWECTSRAPIYIFNIFLQRSFFKRVVVLMRRAKSRRLGERPEQSRAMGHPCKRRTLSPEEREKYTSDFDPFFFFSSSLGVAAVSGLFSLFFGSVRLFTHTHT